MFFLQLRDTTNAVEDRSSASSYDDNDIRDLGNLTRGLQTADLNKVDPSALTGNMETIGKNLREKSAMSAVMEHVLNNDTLVKLL